MKCAQGNLHAIDLNSIGFLSLLTSSSYAETYNGLKVVQLGEKVPGKFK
jgi:hypothetical protein